MPHCYLEQKPDDQLVQKLNCTGLGPAPHSFEERLYKDQKKVSEPHLKPKSSSAVEDKGLFSKMIYDRNTYKRIAWCECEYL